MVAPEPRLETDRLILRLPEARDFDAWAAFAADEEAARYLGGAQSRPAAWRGMAQMTGAWRLRGFSMFSVEEKATGRWVGRVGPWQPEAWPGTEVGWGIVRERWGQGYAAEAAVVAIDWAFATFGWDEVIHCIDPENANSQAVAKKLGSTLLRRTRLPAPFDHMEVDVWGQSRDQWMARRR